MSKKPRESQTKFMAGVVARAHAREIAENTPVIIDAPAIGVTVQEIGNAAPELAQEPTQEIRTVPEGKPEEIRNPAPAKKQKKLSPTVIAWKAHKEHYPNDGIIKVLGPNIKRGKAKVRFELYTDGMTVLEYVDKSFAKGNSKALAHADIRWDVVKKFISVE